MSKIRQFVYKNVVKGGESWWKQLDGDYFTKKTTHRPPNNYSNRITGTKQWVLKRVEGYEITQI
jgi:hypothetical protein